MTPRLLVWLFPFLMVIFEYLLRLGLPDPYDLGFVGPTLGAAALGMLLPLTRLAEIARAREPGPAAVQSPPGKGSRADFVGASANIALWFGLAAWMTSVHLSIGGKLNAVLGIDGMRTSMLIGCILWLIAVVLDVACGGEK